MAGYDEISRIIRGGSAGTPARRSITEIIRSGTARPFGPATTAQRPRNIVEFLQEEEPWRKAFRQRLESATQRTLTFGFAGGQPQQPPRGVAEWAGEVAGTVVGALPGLALAAATGGAAVAPLAGAAQVGAAARFGPTAARAISGAIRGLGTGAAFGAMEAAAGVARGEKPQEAVKAIPREAALFGAFEAGTLALGPMLGRLLPRRGKVVEKPKQMLALPAGASYEAGTREVLRPRRFRLETGEERLSRVIETIRPEVERQRQQAVRIRQLLSGAGAPPIESKKAAVEFLGKAIPEVPKSAWRTADIGTLQEMVQAIAEGAQVLPGGLEPIAVRVARAMGFDLRREFEIANLPATERLRALAQNNHWRMILGLREAPSLRQPPRAPEPFVRRIEPWAGTAQLTTPGVQRIAQPGTREWEEAVLRQSGNQRKAVAEAARLAGSVGQHASAPSPPKPNATVYRDPAEKAEVWRRYVSSVEGWLRSKGEPGQRIVGMAREAEKIADQQITRWTNDMLSKVVKLTPQERVNMRDVVRGDAQPMNAKVAEAADAVRAYYAERPQRIQQAGLTLRTADGQNIPFQPQPNHFPLRLDWRKLEEHGRFKQSALEYLVKTGQASSLEEAERLLRILRRIPYERHATFQHEATRIKLPEFELDPLLALRSDLNEAETRIAQALVYGPKDERLLQAIEAMHPADRQHAILVANGLRGLDATDVYTRHIVEGLLSYNVLTKLGLAAIPNATQTLNTALKLGVKQFIRGIRNAFLSKQEALEFARAAGIHLDPENVARVIAEAGPDFWSTITPKFLRAVGFNATEFWNRLITTQAAKGWAEDMFRALQRPGSVSWVRRIAGQQPARIRRLFAEAGVDVDAALQRGALSDDDLYRIARWVVQRTQFPASKLDVPLWASSPWGRIVFQFKRYAFNQGRLLKNELWDETVRFFHTGGKEGSLRAWGPFLTLFPAAGWLVGAIRDWVAGRENPAQKLQRLSERIEEEGALRAFLEEMVYAYMWVGGLGILSDIIQQLRYGEEKLLSSLLGP